MSGPDLVYVVDDDPSVVRAMQRLLRSAGLATMPFASASEFLGRQPSTGPSCVVLDVRLPDRSGIDLQQELASRGDGTPIVFITGHGDVPMSVRAMKDGAIDFLPKPFQDDELLAAVRRALDLDRERRAERASLDALVARLGSLTPRESEVFALVVTGMLNKQIALELGTAEKTVKVHRGRVMEKMQAASFADLVRMAGRLGASLRAPR